MDNLHEMDFGYYEKKPYFASPDESPRGLRRLSLLAKVMLAQATGETLRQVGVNEGNLILTWNPGTTFFSHQRTKKRIKMGVKAKY